MQPRETRPFWPQICVPSIGGGTKARSNKPSIQFDKDELRRLVSYLRSVGDGELLEKVMAHTDSFKAARQNLMASIKAKRLQPKLWDAYVEACRRQGIQESLPGNES